MFGYAALFTPGIIHAARRHPLDRGRWGRSAIAHAAFGTLFAVSVKLLWDISILHWYRTPWATGEFTWGVLVKSLFDGFQVNLLLYWMVVIGVTALDDGNRYRSVSREAAQLRAQLAETRLEVLRAQLDPHFLFNTLNSISAMVHADPDGAEQMIANLSELLRRSLDQRARHEVLLSVEIAFTKLYLEIQSRRFEERLQVRYEIEPEANDALVPGMILQPLVENSVRHAIAPRVCGGVVILRAGVKDGELWLEVEDEGGEPAIPVWDEGVGLGTTRERLISTYGNRASVELTPGQGGLKVRIVLPLLLEGSDDAVTQVASHYR